MFKYTINPSSQIQLIYLYDIFKNDVVASFNLKIIFIIKWNFQMKSDIYEKVKKGEIVS